jgi:hypothetical protein
MVRQTEVLHRVPVTSRDQQLVDAYTQGIKAGLAGAFTIAIWFAIIDVLRGQPLHTPTVLGTALFRGVGALDDPASLGPSFEMVVGFTWIHMLLFLMVGMAAGRLMELAEHDSHVGFGVVLFACIFEAGFIVACTLFAEPVLRELTIPAILVGNLFAAAAMGAVLWRSHRLMAIEP